MRFWPWTVQRVVTYMMHRVLPPKPRCLQERLRRTGLGALTAEQGLAALGGVLSASSGALRAADTLAVTPVDWPTFLRRLGGSVPAVFAESGASAQQLDAPSSKRHMPSESAGVSTPTASEVAAAVRKAVRDIAGRDVPDSEPLMSAGAPDISFHVALSRTPRLRSTLSTIVATEIVT